MVVIRKTMVFKLGIQSKMHYISMYVPVCVGVHLYVLSVVCLKTKQNLTDRSTAKTDVL